MFKIPTGNKEKKEASISVRVRASVLERLKEIATQNNVSQSEIIEALVDQAYEEIINKKTKREKGKK